MQGPSAIVIGLIRIGSILKQPPNHRGVIVDGCVMQVAGAVFVALVYVINVLGHRG